MRFGFSYSDSVGFQGIFSLAQDNFDFTDLPTSFYDFLVGGAFVGDGKSLSFNIQPGRTLSSYSVSYRDPHLLDSDTRLSVGLQYLDTEYTRWDQRKEGVSLGLGRNLGTAHGKADAFAQQGIHKARCVAYQQAAGSVQSLRCPMER